MTKRTGIDANLGSLYRRFADTEAQGVSALYEEFARDVAGNRDIHQFLLTLPPDKRQPNLLFASVRLNFGTAADGPGFCKLLLDNPDVIAATMLCHATQTNEPARCAVLLPILAALPQPLALLEVGTSAGLCLFPDQYNYCYNEESHVPARAAGDAPVFNCKASINTPLPIERPTVTWRAGIDLNPLDVRSSEDVNWLQALVWPEHYFRRENLLRAVDIARRSNLSVTRGDLTSDMESLIAQAPDDATLVVFHTAVLAYVNNPEDRKAFANRMMKTRGTWISNEHPGVFPEISKQLGIRPPDNRFLLAVDGKPVASTGPHGQSIDWHLP